jgi:hypothetical protein
VQQERARHLIALFARYARELFRASVVQRIRLWGALTLGALALAIPDAYAGHPMLSEDTGTQGSALALCGLMVWAISRKLSDEERIADGGHDRHPRLVAGDSQRAAFRAGDSG